MPGTNGTVFHYGGTVELRDAGLLESAIEQPRATFGGQFLHAYPFEMAAAYLFHIVNNHPFVDGNKWIEFALRFMHEVVDKLMKKANLVCRVILGLSRYGGLRTPSETLSLRWDDIDWEMNWMSIPEPKVEHHAGHGIRSCPIFPELRPILDEAFEIFGDKSEFVVAAPQYRAAVNTAMGWKNANLRSELRIEN